MAETREEYELRQLAWVEFEREWHNLENLMSVETDPDKRREMSHQLSDMLAPTHLRMAKAEKPWDGRYQQRRKP